MKVSFTNKSFPIDFLAISKIKKVIRKIGSDFNKEIGEINFTFIDDVGIKEVNSNFLNHNYYTDIITFDNSFINIISGDIFISLETVMSNSKKYSTDFDKELYRVVFHGVLHLCGLNDSTEKEKNVMRNKEDNYLSYLEKL